MALSSCAALAVTSAALDSLGMRTPAQWSLCQHNNLSGFPAAVSARTPDAWQESSSTQQASKGTWQISPVQEHGSIGDEAWKDC